MDRPAKRSRVGNSPYDQDDDELVYEPEEVSRNRDPGYQLEKSRTIAAFRLKSTFEHIFAKYERDFSGIGDEIDLGTGEILVDNGHLHSMRNERDTGEAMVIGEASPEDEDEGILLEDAFPDGFSEEESTQEVNAPAEDEQINHDADSATEDEDRILLHGGRPNGASASTALSVKPKLELQNRGGFHSRIGWQVSSSSQRLSSTFVSPSHSLLAPQAFSFGTWGATHDSVDPAWRVPDILPPNHESPFATALNAERYDLPVRRGVESIWAPGNDKEEDKIIAKSTRESTAAVIQYRAPGGSRPATISRKKLLSDIHTAEDGEDDDDILLGSSQNVQKRKGPRTSELKAPVEITDAMTHPSKKASTAVSSKKTKQNKGSVLKEPEPTKNDIKNQLSTASHTSDAKPTKSLKKAASTNNLAEDLLIKETHSGTHFRPTRKSLSARSKQSLASKARKPEQAAPSLQRASDVIGGPRRSCRPRKQTVFTGKVPWVEVDKRLRGTSYQTLLIEIPARPPTPSEFLGDLDDTVLRGNEPSLEQALPDRPAVEDRSIARGSTRNLGSDQAELEIPDSQAASSISSHANHVKSSPRVIPDSQDSQSVPSSAPKQTVEPQCLSEKALTSANTEKFSRNQIDPTYTFSDEEEVMIPRAKVRAVKPSRRSVITTTARPVVEGSLEKGPENRQAKQQANPQGKPQANSQRKPQAEQQALDAPVDAIEKERSTATKTNSSSVKRRVTIDEALTTQSANKNTISRRTRSAALKDSPPASDSQTKPSTSSNAELTVPTPVVLAQKSPSNVKFNPVNECVASQVSVGSPNSYKGPKTPQEKSKLPIPTSKGSSSRHSIISLIPNEDEDELTLDLFTSTQTFTVRVASHASSVPSSTTSHRTARFRPSLLASAIATASQEKGVATPKKHGAFMRTDSSSAGSRGRKRHYDSEAATNHFSTPAARRVSSPPVSMIQTPGGTLRRCGEDGFRCDRDFCFSCL
jgi:hypothetical protein